MIIAIQVGTNFILTCPNYYRIKIQLYSKDQCCCSALARTHSYFFIILSSISDSLNECFYRFNSPIIAIITKVIATTGRNLNHIITYVEKIYPPPDSKGF